MGICSFGFEVFSTLKPLLSLLISHKFSEAFVHKPCGDAILRTAVFCKFARESIPDFYGRATSRLFASFDCNVPGPRKFQWDQQILFSVLVAVSLHLVLPINSVSDTGKYKYWCESVFACHYRRRLLLARGLAPGRY